MNSLLFDYMQSEWVSKSLKLYLLSFVVLNYNIIFGPEYVCCTDNILSRIRGLRD
jgi:hypothetical protein